MHPNSVSPIRSYDDTLGGGKVLSMKPNFLLNSNPMMQANNPYRALYYLPHTQGESYPADPGAVRENIQDAVKYYFLHERENLKQELVDEAMTDIRNEINHSYFIADDQLEGGRDDYASRSERHKSHKKMTREITLEKKNKTDKKSRNRYEDSEEEENRPLNTSDQYESDPKKIKSRSKTEHVSTKKSKKDKKGSKKDCPRKSKSKDNLKASKTAKSGYASKSSKRSYEFDFDSDAEKPRQKKGHRVYLKKTPQKSRASPPPNRDFTFEKQPRELQQELNTLKENMKDFELQMVSMVRNLKIDIDNRDKLTDEKLKLARDPIGDYQSVREELEFTKKLIDALEEERKKDMLRSKQFVEEKAKDLYNDIELLRAREFQEVDKNLEQTKFEMVEQLIENTDNHKRELREMKYEIDKNKEDINIMANNVKNLRRRANEELDMNENRVIQKSDSNILRSLSQQVDEQMDENLIQLKKDLKKECERIIRNEISQNNDDFVMPSIQTQADRNFATFSSKKHTKEVEENILKSSPVKSEYELDRKIEQAMELKCPELCKKAIEEDLQVIKRDIIDNEIEPICQKMMIEEYARTKRNIIDKEIEPKCKEVLEEEAPAI